MDLENIIPDSTNGSLETRVKKQVFQSELKLLRGEQIMKRLEYGVFKILKWKFLTSRESYCLRLPLSLNSAKTSFIFLEESGET